MSKFEAFIESDRSTWVLSGVVIMIAVICFTAGLMVGHESIAESSTVRHKVTQKAPVPMPTKPAPKPVSSDVLDESLTFYHALPTGDKVEMQVVEPVKAPQVEVVKEKPVVSPATAPAKVASSEKKSRSLPPLVADGKFMVQVASVKSEGGAKGVVRKVSRYDESLKPVVKFVDLGSKGVWYRVLLIGYETKDAAQKVAAVINKNLSLASFVKSK